MWVQRVHLDASGRKVFDCPDYVGDRKLEACLNDEDRLRPHDRGTTVTKVQEGLKADGENLGPLGADGAFGAATGQAVMAFKTKYHLGSEQFPDVGPGTMAKLDALCPPRPVPPTPVPPPAPPTPPPVPSCKVPTNPDMSGRSFNPTTDGQASVAASHPIDAFTANSLADDALAAATASGLPGLHLGRADAFRHALWNCQMAKQLGTTRAEQFATGHENSGPSSIPFDNQMDLHNNAMGRSLSGAPDCESAVRAALAAGQLRTIRGPDTSLPAVPPVPTACLGASDQPWP